MTLRGTVRTMLNLSSKGCPPSRESYRATCPSISSSTTGYLGKRRELMLVDTDWTFSTREFYPTVLSAGTAYPGLPKMGWWLDARVKPWAFWQVNPKYLAA
jgi:hypothetical protein